jgi:hypothetical protein
MKNLIKTVIFCVFISLSINTFGQSATQLNNGISKDTISISNLLQNEITRKKTTFEFGIGGVFTHIGFCEFGLNVKTIDKLYIYPFIRTAFGSYDELSIASFIYGANLRYYIYKLNREPITFYLSAGLNNNAFINDDDYSFKSNGINNEFSIGCEILNIITKSTFNIELGYTSIPSIIDNSIYANNYYVPKVYNNLSTNLGGLFINFKFGLFSYK